jgi:catechol 2,3-dioxygenase-like lactoylglutathione lyase family enzyme
MSRLEATTPVLQVADVARSVAWYRSVLELDADPSPADPSFAILSRDGLEIMLQSEDAKAPHPAATRADPEPGWSIYLRVTGGDILDLARTVREHTPLLRGPERAFYGMVEFEIADPDGHRICVGENLPHTLDVPLRRET